MASVASLDKDLRKMRLDKYTPAAANEVKTWIEETLGERLPSGDLLDGLRDGVALCKLANLALPPPGIKFKQSSMPFVQMENISHFLRACQSPPLNLHEHDIFLTVDLYEQKDPAQVLQCLGAFSRAANAANPTRIANAIGPKARAGNMSPQQTGQSTPTTGFRGRGTSVTSNASSAYGGGSRTVAHRAGDSISGRWSPTKAHHSKTPSLDPPASPGHVSSWSKKEQEGATAPAWNIAQYGYMGGASQGNLGISFGGRRQITNSAPEVPSLADKERRRKELEAEAEEEERRRRQEQEAEEDRARQEEQRRWEEETARLRDEERHKADEEKRRWEEEERQWKLTEEKRRKDEQEAEAKMEEERSRARNSSQVKLRGQFLSQYQSERSVSGDAQNSDSDRIRHLEKELEQARQREAEYERERLERGSSRAPAVAPPTSATDRARSRSRPRSKSRQRYPGVSTQPQRQDSWVKGEREVLQTHWDQHQEEIHRKTPEPTLLPQAMSGSSTADEKQIHAADPLRSPRPLPDPSSTKQVKSHNTGGSSRPLPDPATYTSSIATPPTPNNRTGRFLSSNPAPVQHSPQPTYARELGATEERDAEDRRRVQSQLQAKAGGWASKSLLEREMELERERQREWEEAQKETAKAVKTGDHGVDGIGGGIGGRWDVGQWAGYTGGDNQNKGNQGIGAGRRQIVGPRPLPGSNR